MESAIGAGYMRSCEAHDRIGRAASGAALGFLLGALVGTSGSPVVSSVVSALAAVLSVFLSQSYTRRKASDELTQPD